VDGGGACARLAASHPLRQQRRCRSSWRLAAGARREPEWRTAGDRHRRGRSRRAPVAGRGRHIAWPGSAARRPVRGLPGADPRGRSVMKPYLLEMKYEFLHLLRTPIFALPTVLFPVMFYLLFGVVMNSGPATEYLLATYGVFGVMGASMFGFGVTVAIEREQGFLHLKRALPMP